MATKILLALLIERRFICQIESRGDIFGQPERARIMDNIGYFMSEAPFLVLIIASTVKLVAWRRSRANRPVFGEEDRRVLSQTAHYGPSRWEFYPRFVLAVFAVLAVSLLQFIALAPLGAAVLTATLVLSSAAIVRALLLTSW